MKILSLRSAGRALIFALAWLVPLFATGKTPPTPTAEADAVIDRWVEAIGGAKRLKAIKQSDYRLRLTVGAGTVLEMQSVALASGPYRLVMQTPLGELITADDGRIGWLHHAGLGGRVLDAAKAERQRRNSGPAEPLRTREYYPERRRLPDMELGGKKFTVVELTDRHGGTEQWFFDPTTGLRVRREYREDEKSIATEYSDFRKVNGVIEPFRLRSTINGQQISLLEVQAASHLNKVTVEAWQAPEGLEADSKRVEEALRRFEAALGTKEAVERLRSRVTKTHLEMSTNGMAFDMTMSQRKPDRVLIEQDIPGVGRMLQGYDGKTGWAWGEMQGYRELHGPELAQLIGSANLAPRKIGEDTPLRRIVGESTGADGHRVLAVDLATVAGSAGVFHFDLETGLLVKLETVVQAGPGGSIKIVMDLGDYREVDGVKIAFSQTMTNPAMRMTTKVLEVAHNRELPDEIFLPRKNGEIPGKAAAIAPAAPPTKEEPAPAPAAPAAPAK